MPMAIVKIDAGATVADLTAANPFGVNPDGGKPKGNAVNDQRFIQPIQGARVHIPGPLALSSAIPTEMIRLNDTPTGTVFGFEISGSNLPAGGLVRNSSTY